MKWFYKWFGKKINQSMNDDGLVEAESSSPNLITAKQSRHMRVRESDDIASEPIQFKMYKASGGWAIEFRHYDRKNDRVDSNLYVVNDEQELGDHISKIITMEALKR
jgi:hypothetical protein